MRAATILFMTRAGCASTMHQAPAQSYRLKGSDIPVSIRGKIVRDVGMSTNHKVAIGINEFLAAEGSIGRGNGEVSGNWNGRPVLALCNRSDTGYGGVYNIHCRVMIDGEFAATLTF